MSLLSTFPVRLGFLYAAIGAMIGIQLPYWPLFLSSKGLNPEEIGEILAIAYCAKLISNPLAGHLADLRGDCKWPLLILTVTGFVSTLLFFPATGFVPLLLVTLLTSAATTTFLPLADSLAMLAAAQKLADYGRARLWASTFFIIASVLGGSILVGINGSFILVVILVTLFLAIIAAYRLPDLRVPPPPEKRHPIGALIGNPLFLLFLLATGLLQVSHVVYYGFSTLYWRSAGLSGGVIGILWAEGVVAEVLTFAFGTRLLARFGAGRLMLAGGIAGLVRWSVLAATTDPALIATVQWMHALTFASAHLGAMSFISRALPPELGARAQAFYQAISNGLIFGLLAPLAGLLYTLATGTAFWAASALSFLGLASSLLLLHLWRGGNIVATAQ